MRQLASRLAALESRTSPARTSDDIPAHLLVLAQMVALHGFAMPGEVAPPFEYWAAILDHAGQLKRAGVIEIERTTTP